MTPKLPAIALIAVFATFAGAAAIEVPQTRKGLVHAVAAGRGCVFRTIVNAHSGRW